jgi:hypothetical protein
MTEYRRYAGIFIIDRIFGVKEVVSYLIDYAQGMKGRWERLFV